MSDAKQQEAKRLNTFKSVVKVAISAMDKRINDYAKEIQERKDYLWEARRDMDHLEKIAVRGIIEQALDSAEILQQQQQKLKKLMLSPYFGRFDFTREDAAKSEPVYIGVSYFRDEEEKQTLVYDWRAPIASMFYDYELGAAKYEAPSGVIEGDISLKRQMKIEQGDLRYVFDSSVNIVDDVLKEALSEASDDEGMKNIVATIQRDQNAIIRNDEAHTLIIQGVAGSGKTSIALHRIAYLLYRFRDEIMSDDILIISPNRVFADYIGNVLPELGEEKVPEVGMDDLAAELLDYSYKFQTLFEQSNALLESKDKELQNRIQAKSTVEFLRNIDHYVGHLDKTAFQARDWRAGRKIVPDWFFEETWARHKNTNEKERLKRIVADTALFKAPSDRDHKPVSKC
ncbi:MAG: hypothetical protein LC639_02830 [Idiomarina sp.]|nr:hypothetical protein [Idiomarina sp.]